jgi:hypothetical protein
MVQTLIGYGEFLLHFRGVVVVEDNLG